MIDEHSIQSVQSGGSSLVEIAPLITHDSRFLICPCGSQIKVFSIETGECLSVLSGHDDKITAVSQHSKIKLQVVSSSMDKTLRIWDYEDGVLLKTAQLTFEVFNALTHFSLNSNILLLKKHEDSGFSLVSYSLENFKHKIVASSIDSDAQNQICVGNDGSYVACANVKSVIIADPLHRKFCNSLEFDSKFGNITCIAAHPNKQCFATGHTSGNICIWYNFLSPQTTNELTIQSLHWHQNEVGDIAFTTDGSYLLSVGAEGVLVQWQHTRSDKKRNYFPRIGYPMKYIIVSSDGLLFATSHSDNSIHVISNTMNIKQTIEGFTASSSLKQGLDHDRILPCGMKYDWKTQSTVTNGKHGHLLFYKAFEDKQMYNLDIVGQNYVMKAKMKHETYISNVAFTNKYSVEGNLHELGHWMATCEERTTKKVTHEQRLKIWEFDEAEQGWRLNMVIHYPHKSVVKKMVFRPVSTKEGRAHFLITAASDGQIKVWQMDISTEGRVIWSCVSSTIYRGEPLTDMDVSQDGSLLSVSYTTTVCVAPIEQLDELKEVVTLPNDEKTISVHFGRFSSQSLLLIATNNGVFVYDLISQEITNVYECEPVLLCRDDLSDVAAIFTKDDKVVIVKPSTIDSPIAVLHNIKTSHTIASCFVPLSDIRHGACWFQNNNVEWMKTSRLFYINSDMTVHCLCTDTERRNKLVQGSSRSVLSANGADTLKTPMASVIEHSVKQSKTRATISDTTTVTHKIFKNSVKRIIEVPCHTLPSMTSLCNEFLTSLLLSKSTTKLVESPQDDFNDADSDAEMRESSSSDEELTHEDDAHEPPLGDEFVSSDNFTWIKSF